MNTIGKRVCYLDGTAACYKSSILSSLSESDICYTSSSDLTELREEFPKFYTRQDGIQFVTIPWYSMFLSQLFLSGRIGSEYNVMCCDRLPVATFVNDLIFKNEDKLSIQDLKEILPKWCIDFFNTTKTIFLIDTDIDAVKKRLIKRGGFDTDRATDEYFILQNNYFKAVSEICNIPCIDINGKSYSYVCNFVKDWITSNV